MSSSFAVDLVFKSQGLGKINDAARQLQGVENTSKKAQTGLKGVGAASRTAAAGVSTLGAAVAAALAPIASITAAVAFFNKALAVSSDREADVMALADALGRMGKTTKDLETLQKQANEFGNATLFNQEDFTKASKNLTSFTDIALKDYERIINASADIATKTGGNVQEAALQLAKALNAPTQNLSALSRSGIQFSDSQKEVIKQLVATGQKAEAQKLILKELEKQYGGAAKAAAGGFAGSVDTLGEKFRDFQQGVGKITQSLLKPFVDGLASLFGAISRVQPAFQLLLQAMGRVAAAFSPITEALGLNQIEWEQWVGAIEMAYKIAAVIVDKIAKVVQGMAQRIGKIIEGLSGTIGRFFGWIGNAVNSFFGITVDNTVSGMDAIVQTVINGLERIRAAIALLINSTGPGLFAQLFGFNIGESITQPIKDLQGGIRAVYAEAKALKLPSFTVNTNGGGFESALDSAPGGGSTGSKGGGKGKSAKDAAEEAAKLERQIAELVKRGTDLGERLGVAFATPSTPLQESISGITRELRDADAELEELLLKVAELSGGDPKFAGAVSTLTAIREQLAGANVEKIASERLTKSDVQSYEQQSRELKAQLAALKEGRTELTEIEKLAVKYGEDWKNLHPETRQHLTDLANTNQLLKDNISEVQKQAEQVQKQEELWANVGQTVQTALVDTIQQAIEGTADLNDILSNLAKQLGGMFLNAGFSMLGAGIGLPGFAGGGYTGNAPRSGGIDGEGGFPAILHPGETVVDHRQGNSGMHEAMRRYNAGNNAGGAGGGGAAGEAGGGGISPVINIQTGNTLNFEGTNYVSRSDFYAGLDQAAKEGAKQGEVATLRRLQNSGTTRRKLGL